MISEEQKKLVLNNQGLVHHLVRKLDISPNDYEDIVSIGTLGLVKAATTFDDSKKIAFATYASKCINNEIFMYFRKEKKHLQNFSLDYTIEIDNNGNEVPLSDMISSPEKHFTEEIIQNETFVHIINIILNSLQPKERLVTLYNIAGINQYSIAQILNLSQSYISRLEKKSKDKIKLYLTTHHKFKKVFTMVIADDLYKIIFSLEDIQQFNKIFSTLLQNLTSEEVLPYFTVNYNNKQITIQVPACYESFYFIAQIIQEIDNYSMKLNTLPDNNKEITSDIMKKNAKH